ncbi:MmcB family DNA repair protein [Dongia rigui]|uniref:MmcB family DNA repair protein n=1 Tax=Dongia rigui TaxID=940149 RepID=A0ABU5DVD6_9PROT|nr:MmcB family DNA repair protein [Dongia rigui]MDY0870663.1 MmcB family DNA repair protein [Dongia rigui]
MAEISNSIPLPPAGLGGDGDALIATGIARGVMRLFADLGYAALQEFPLRAKRRADIVALNDAGEFVIVEIKSCRADFRADQKWPEYLDFCDRFFFAVAPPFPREILPADRGLIIADRHGGAILRDSQAIPLNGNRRRAQTLQLAITASQRLARVMEMMG